MKEISSDGDLSTVDVIYPASPFFIHQNPFLLDLMLRPLMAYANNETSSSTYNYPCIALVVCNLFYARSMGTTPSWILPNWEYLT